MQEINIRDFKYCIYKSHIITDETIEGMTAGKAIHNLALSLNQTFDDGFLRMTDISLEARAKKFTF